MQNYNHTQIAVISDIHGNVEALRAVLEDIDRSGITTLINLGDSIYGPLWPEETANLLRERKIPSLMGNEDEIIFSASSINPTLDYIHGQISESTLQWLREMPFSIQLGNRILAIHGSLATHKEYLIEKVVREGNDGIEIKTDEELCEELLSVNEPIILCGHSHKPNWISLENEKHIINPGSIGLQSYNDDIPFFHKIQNFNPFAKYAVVEILENELQVSFKTIPYNFKNAAYLARKNNREDWYYWLLTGRA